MNVVDQSLDDWLTHLKLSLARTDGVTKLTFDHRVDCFNIPALPEEPIQTSSGNQICSGFPFRMNKFAMSSNRRNDVQRIKLMSIKACIRQHHPGALSGFAMSTKSSTAAFQRVQMSHIVTGSIPRVPG